MEKLPVDLFAYYFQQYHPIKENDEWWGEGFTEWDLVKCNTPLFPDHYQPRVPADLGYYDLRDPSIFSKQAEMAKYAGLDGFIFYWYWFSGKKLLADPIYQFMDRYEELGLKFMLLWHNGEWRRIWRKVNGKDYKWCEPLIGFDRKPEDDDKLMDDLIPIFNHPAYYKVNGRPVLLVMPFISPFAAYTSIEAAKRATKLWRVRTRENGAELLIGAATANLSVPIDYADFRFEYHPYVSKYANKLFIAMGDRAGRCDVKDYSSIHKNMKFDINSVPSVYTTGIDDSSRCYLETIIMHNVNPNDYYIWLKKTLEHAQTNPAIPNNPLVFINAWNEWGMGLHLEPDQKWGWQYLDATRKAMYPEMA